MIILRDEVIIADRSCVSDSPDETRLIASEFARNAQAGTVLSLIGDLGAGKTEFVKGLATRTWGRRAKSPVPPSLLCTSIEEVDCHFSIWTSIVSTRSGNWMRSDFDDYLKAGGVCAIEWGDKFPNRLPPDSVKVFVSHSCADDRRDNRLVKSLLIENSTETGKLSSSATRRSPGPPGIFKGWKSCPCRCRRFFELGAPDEIIVGIGPGSYTGLRVAAATAIGLQLALGCPAFGCPSVLGYQNGSYHVVGDARLGSVFLASVEGKRLTRGPELLPREVSILLPTAGMTAPFSPSDRSRAS